MTVVYVCDTFLVMDKMGRRKMHPNSLANLHPVQKGEIRNPKGPGKKIDCLIDCIKAELAKPSLAPGLTNEQLIAAMLVSQATKGNLKAAELIMSYTTAKPTASVDLNAKGSLELLVRWDGNRDTPGSTPAATAPTSS